MAPTVNEFEKAREEAIARNRAMLEALGLNENIVRIPNTTKKAAASKNKKRKPAPAEDAEEGENNSASEQPARKVLVVQTGDDASSGPRRSTRNAGKKVDYAGDGDMLRKDDGPKILTEKARKAAESEPKGVQHRKHDPYVVVSRSRLT